MDRHCETNYLAPNHSPQTDRCLRPDHSPPTSPATSSAISQACRSPARPRNVPRHDSPATHSVARSDRGPCPPSIADGQPGDAGIPRPDPATGTRPANQSRYPSLAPPLPQDSPPPAPQADTCTNTHPTTRPCYNPLPPSTSPPSEK